MDDVENDPNSTALRGLIGDVVDAVAKLVRAPGVDDADRVDRLVLLTRAQAALAAAVVVEAVEFESSQLAAQAAQGVPAARRGRGVADQIGYATRISPAAMSRRLADARVLVREMPHTLHALADGRVSEHGAVVAVRETRCLTAGHRAMVDVELARVVETMSVRQVEHAVRARVIELDQAAAVRRAALAREDRFVSIRPLPDTMAKITAVLPVEQGVAVWASLRAAAATAHAAGDDRSKAQVMADVLVERATGQATAIAVPVEVQVVMTSDALLARTEEPAQIPGHGPIPAYVARRILTREPDAAGTVTGTDHEPAAAADVQAVAATADGEKARVWIRRLLIDPVDGTVTGIDTTRRRFDGVLRAFINARDQVCRDPFCSAPIRDIDHLHDHADGGPTSAENGVGLCQRGNLVDQIPGWHTTGTATQRTVITPTGHRYQTRPPPALGPTLNAPTGRTGPARPTEPRSA